MEQDEGRQRLAQIFRKLHVKDWSLQAHMGDKKNLAEAEYSKCIRSYLASLRSLKETGTKKEMKRAVTLLDDYQANRYLYRRTYMKNSKQSSKTTHISTSKRLREEDLDKEAHSVATDLVSRNLSDIRKRLCRRGPQEPQGSQEEEQLSDRSSPSLPDFNLDDYRWHLNNVCVTDIMKQIKRARPTDDVIFSHILDLTNFPDNHRVFFGNRQRALVDEIMRLEQQDLSMELVALVRVVSDAKDAKEARKILDQFVISPNLSEEKCEELRWGKSVLEVFIDDWRHENRLQDPTMTERTFNTVFIVAIFKFLMTLSGFKQDWNEKASYASLAAKRSVTDTATFREANLIDGLGVFGGKYELHKLETAGTPFFFETHADAQKVVGDKEKIYVGSKDGLDQMAELLPGNDIERCRRLRVFGSRVVGYTVYVFYMQLSHAHIYRVGEVGKFTIPRYFHDLHHLLDVFRVVKTLHYYLNITIIDIKEVLKFGSKDSKGPWKAFRLTTPPPVSG